MQVNQVTNNKDNVKKDSYHYYESRCLQVSGNNNVSILSGSLHKSSLLVLHFKNIYYIRGWTLYIKTHLLSQIVIGCDHRHILKGGIECLY